MASSSSGRSGGPNDGDRGSNRRPPQNLDGLLKFCVENTAAEDARGGDSDYTSMSEERRQWLQDALNSLADQDPVKHMLELIHLSTEPGNEPQNIETKEAALEELMDYCEDFDLAKDFHKIGGFQLISNYLHSEHEGIRWRTGDLLATLVQNHPYCQQEALKDNFMPILLNVLDTDSSGQVRTKALYAVSCLTRDNPEAQEKFVSLDGFSVLMRAMQGEEEKLQTKAAFMLGAVCISEPKYKDTLCDMGMVEQLIGLLRGEHKTFHEHLIGALLSLASDHPRSVAECQRAELGLKQNLEDRIKTWEGHEEYNEEVQYSQQLLEICFGGGPSSSSVDR